MDKTKELENRIKVLEDFIRSLQSFSSIPLNVDGAFRKRLSVVSGDSSSVSAKTTTVHEAGASTYEVAKKMDGFIKITVNGNARLVPYYN